MNKKSLASLLAALIALLFTHGAAATTLPSIPLGIDQLQSIQASIPVSTNTLAVNVSFLWKANGQIIAAAASTVDGAPASARAVIKKLGTNITYSISITAAGRPRTTLSLSGKLGTNVARCAYSGPKGRTRLPAQPVTLATTLAAAQIDVLPNISSRGRISGTGTILAYGTNSATAGRLSGSVSQTKLAWSLKQAARVVSFKGIRSDDAYVGALKVLILPDRETIQPFSIPASVFKLSSGTALFQGTVLASSNAAPTAADGVTVMIKCDFNGDGKFTADELRTVTTHDGGKYQVSFPVQAGRTVLFELSMRGYARYMNAYPTVTPGSTVTKNCTLQVLNTIAVSGGKAESRDGKLVLTGLPAGISNVQARVFNPNTDTAQFPGEFKDSEKNLLVSSVFAAIEARNGQGNSVTNLGPNTTVCIEVPLDSWSTMGDLNLANDQIDVPLYSYDEVKGEWKRSSADGWLEDTNRVKIPPADLASIQNGSYEGRVFAVGPITHLSYWNIDWPIETHACIQAAIVDATNGPIAGATVTVRGLTYTGTTSPKITEDDGTFCADVMRTEGVGEDVDRDGVTGETHQVQVTVRLGADVYSFGPFSTPGGQGTCDTGGCLDLGMLRLSDATKLQVTMCTINGQMTYSGTTTFGPNPPISAGTPLADATVMAFDEENSDLMELCVTNNSCSFFAQTAADGKFSLTVPMLSSVTVYGYKYNAISSGAWEYFVGSKTFDPCPGGLVNLPADYWSIHWVVVTLIGNNVSSGSLMIVNDQLTAVIASGNNYYAGTKAALSEQPTQLGPWLSVPMMGSSAATLTLSVTGLSPLTGTWNMGALSGTFTEQE